MTPIQMGLCVFFVLVAFVVVIWPLLHYALILRVGNPAFPVAFIESLTDDEVPARHRAAAIACMYETRDCLRKVARATIKSRKMVNEGIESGVVDGQLPGQYQPWGTDVAVTKALSGKLIGGVWGDQAEGEETYYAPGKDRYSDDAVRAFCLRNRYSRGRLDMGKRWAAIPPDRRTWKGEKNGAVWELTWSTPEDVYYLKVTRKGGPLGLLYTQYGHKPWPALNGDRTGTVIALTGVRWKRGE